VKRRRPISDDPVSAGNDFEAHIGSKQGNAPSLITIDRPFAGMARELKPARLKLSLAAIAYLVKDSPVWVLPLITSSVIDTVVAGGGRPRNSYYSA
jgi:hypothetical protein